MTPPLPSILFCEHLWERGVLTAEEWDSGAREPSPAIDEWIQRADRMARLDAPGVAPVLDMPSVYWALSVLAWSVNLLVDRANTRTELPNDLVASEPTGALACHHWSADLALHYLGDVLLRALAAAAQDTLVQELRKICLRWPLSSVGTQTEWQVRRGQVILDDDCLRSMLLDRIIARDDGKLAEDPVINGYIKTRKASR